MTEAAPTQRADLVTVGAGPQTLRALADLEIELAARGEAATLVRVLAVDPADAGPGAVWRVDQPRVLAMNVSAALVDLRCPSVPWDLREWHARELGSPCPAYPARGRVGEYLRWAWERLARSPWFALEHLRGVVTGVEADGDGWVCRVDGGPIAAAPRVLLCTGHREVTSFDPAALVAGDAATGPSSTVVVRGAALTAFDAVMCLTAGRGGTWEPTDDAVPRYRASGREPQRVVLRSRSSRMMVPKPLVVSTGLRDAVDGLRERWAQVEPLGEGWWDILVEAAQAAAAAHDVDLDTAAARAWLDDPPTTRGSAAVAARWRADLRRAGGDVDGDPAWWLGRAWSAAYPDLLASIERHPRDVATWPVFRRRAATLERWAFGPPAELVARLVALIDAGLLAVETDAAGEVGESDGPEVVAHIAPPGVLPQPRAWSDDDVGSLADVVDAPLWSRLLTDGHVTVRPGETGVLTTPAGTCVRADGGRSDGLSALGRPTEGPVVDHDSLQRRLHLDSSRWAAATADGLTVRSPETVHPDLETAR